MDRYQMNRMNCRPYQNTCGMNCSMEPRPQPHSKSGDCACHMPGVCSGYEEMFSHLKHLPLAMGYVPCQKFDQTFELCKALKMGTIFPELCKPFCGRRGCYR